MLPNLMHGNPGFAQIGYRFIVDALPMLWILLAITFRLFPATGFVSPTICRPLGRVKIISPPAGTKSRRWSRSGRAAGSTPA